MRKFVMMNTLAVVKITKKHDKNSERHLQADMVAAVHRHHFYSSPRFGTVRYAHTNSFAKYIYVCACPFACLCVCTCTHVQ